MVWISVALAAATALTPKPFAVRFDGSVTGRNVTICLDGRFVESTFAGKMAFRDDTHRWMSVCADVRGPVHQGQIFGVRALSRSGFGGKVAKAGNIVASYFADAQTADQCAGLQLAVWKALEDGSDVADFSSGRFQARATNGVMSWAEYYYRAVNTPGEAAYLQTGNGGNQGSPFSASSGQGGAAAGGAGAGAGGGSGGQSQLAPP